MQTDYIQLPPLPMNLTTETIEMIWLFAKMKRNEQEMVQDFIKNMVSGSTANPETMKLSKWLQSDDTMETNLIVTEFAELLKELLEKLIVQSCDMAEFVHQHYCVEGKSLEEIAGEANVDQESLRLITRYYDIKES